MSELDFLLPWDSQPQEAVEIDWENPLTKGLAFSAGLSSRSIFRDDVLGKNGTPSGSVVISPSGIGTSAKFDGSSYLDYGSGDLISSTSPFTITLYEETGTAGAYNSLFAFSAGTTRFVMYRGTGAGYTCVIGPLNGGATVREFSSLGAQTNGEKKRFVITGTGGLGSATGLRLWADGVEQTSGTSNLSAAGGNNTIGWGGVNNKFNGKLSDVNLIERIWSDAEIKSYFDQPNQLYRARTIWVPVSAGGGATNLIIQEALHSHTADNIGLTLDTFLSVQEALHSHAADNLVLSVTGSTDLTVQETLHSHTADNLALTLDTFLLLQDALHAHAADNITLSTGAVADLVIQEALHAHTADALVLTLDTFLVIQEAAHAHGADNIAFTLDSLLAVQEATHGHLADNLILSIPGSALSDAEFRQMYDWISELHLVHGLRAGNPLTVTPTSRAAGAVDQTIGEVGTTVTVTRI